MRNAPALHGRDHLPHGADPIPGGGTILAVEMLGGGDFGYFGSDPDTTAHVGFTVSTPLTYTVLAGAVAILVEGVGGGGGGGGSGASSSSTSAAGGGGSSSYGRTLILAPDATYEFYLGAGGTLGVDTGGDGGLGDFTYFGDPMAPLLYVEGGFGGAGVNSAAASGVSGAGGTGAAIGHLTVPGNYGFPGQAPSVVGGQGAPSHFCAGGNGSGPPSFNAGDGIFGSGAGGGGGVSHQGGTGGDGLLIVTTFG